ncbi:hypothetical protein RvY_03040-3 [Ramazzottius varieornatus]|uniref:Uncharacterized protein n=1 Tax=Ramazzottius varieornatus TaxID=947166 RepID=A0A1D1UW83_RAMVA|nr:hypothetical protein RvY_03040-3 [Ramazzottius varieornatus]
MHGATIWLQRVSADVSEHRPSDMLYPVLLFSLSSLAILSASLPASTTLLPIFGDLFPAISALSRIFRGPNKFSCWTFLMRPSQCFLSCGARSHCCSTKFTRHSSEQRQKRSSCCCQQAS